MHAPGCLQVAQCTQPAHPLRPRARPRRAAGIGLGPIPWLLPAEIMPSETRALASSVAASTNWLANFIVGQLFLLVANTLGPFSFTPFALCLVLGVVFVAYIVPETKGKSLEQIQRELRGIS